MKKAACLGLALFAILCLHIPSAALNVKLDGKVIEPDWGQAEYIQFDEQAASHIAFAAAYYAVDTDGRTLYVAVQVCTGQPGAAPGKSAVEVKLASGETIVMRTDQSSQGDYRYTLQYCAQWERDTDVSLEAKITLPASNKAALERLQISYLDKNGIRAVWQEVSPALPEENTSKPRQNNSGTPGTSAHTKAPEKETEQKSTKFFFTGEVPAYGAAKSGAKERTQAVIPEPEQPQAHADDNTTQQTGIAGQTAQPQRNHTKTLVCAAAACIAAGTGCLILLPLLHKKQTKPFTEAGSPEAEEEADMGTDTSPDKPDEF